MIRIFKEKPGVISKKPVWVCICGEYMYLADTFIGLLYTILVKWKDDKNIVG